MLDRIRLVLVDDHPVFIEGLRLLLDADDTIDVVGVGKCGADAISLVADLEPDVLVVDLDLPDMSGAEVIRQIFEPGGDTNVVVLSAYFDAKSMAEAFDAGAITYLPKTQAADSLLESIRQAALGEGTVPQAHVGALLKGMRERSARQSEAAEVRGLLSPREREVLSLLAEGTTVNDAAEQLHISVFTIRGHVRNILSKLEVHSMSQAVALAYRSGLIERSGYGGRAG